MSRVRAVVVLAGLGAALLAGPAAACAGEGCPLICRVFDHLGHPVCFHPTEDE